MLLIFSFFFAIIICQLLCVGVVQAQAGEREFMHKSYLCVKPLLRNRYPHVATTCSQLLLRPSRTVPAFLYLKRRSYGTSARQLESIEQKAVSQQGIEPKTIRICSPTL